MMPREPLDWCLHLSVDRPELVNARWGSLVPLCTGVHRERLYRRALEANRRTSWGAPDRAMPRTAASPMAAVGGAVPATGVTDATPVPSASGTSGALRKRTVVHWR